MDALELSLDVDVLATVELVLVTPVLEQLTRRLTSKKSVRNALTIRFVLVFLISILYLTKFYSSSRLFFSYNKCVIKVYSIFEEKFMKKLLEYYF